MADETITTTSVTEIQTTVENLNESIDTTLDGFKKFTKTVVDGSEDADRAIDKVIKQFARMTKQIRPAVKEFNKFDDIIEGTEKNINALGKTYAKALLAGNKQAMIASSAITQTSLSLLAASRQVKIASDNLGRMSDEFRDATSEIEKANSEISKLESRQKDLSKEIDSTTAKTEDEIKALEEKKLELGRVEVELKRHKVLLAENSERAEQLAIDSIKAADALKKEQVALIDANKALLEKAASERQHNRDLRRMAGGATAVAAAFEEVMDTKFFDYFKKAGSLALVSASFALLIKSMNQVSDHAKATQRIALSLGDTGEVGFGRLAQSSAEATAEVSKLRDLSYRFGYTMEEMTDTMNKVRAGIRMDREGRLTSAAIQDMTQEITAFSRITGTDLDASYQLMEKRVKQFGMTSQEAVANVQEMRITIQQMIPDNKKNTIAMAEMVNIIEEASAASQSYIVDTRIMTQALRGAVNQAENLGVAQKQAKDVAQATGKILSNAPDFIKIPAGFDLVNQLVGGDADRMLNKLDAGTRKQALEIQKALKAGKLDYFVGAKALMDLIGQTDAGLEAQSKHLENTILQGPAAAELIAEQYGIQNRATAVMVTNMMKEAVEMRNNINAATGKQTITFATALVKDAAVFDSMVENANLESKEARKKLIEDMKGKGLSEEQAQAYIDTYQKGLKDTAALQDQLAAERAKGDQADMTKLTELEKKLYMAKFGTKAVELNKALRPVQTLLAEIEEARGSALPVSKVTGKVMLDAKALKAAGLDNAEKLAKRIGIDYDKADKQTRDRLDTMIERGTTPDDIEALRRDFSVANQKQLAAADDYSTKTPAEKTVYWLQNIFARLGWLGPLAGIAAGVAGMAAGIWLISRGQKNAQMMANWVDSLNRHSVQRQVGQALKSLPRRRGGGGGGGDEGLLELPEGKEGKGKGKKRRGRKARAARRRELKTKSRPFRKRFGKGLAAKTELAKDLALKTMEGAKGWGSKIALSTKELNVAAKGLGKKIPMGIGAGISGLLAGKEVYDAYQEGQSGAELAKTGVRAGSGAVGGLGGAALGAMLGTAILPGIGTVLGGAAGGYIGEVIGEKVGDVVSRAIPNDRGLPNTTAMTGTPTTMPDQPMMSDLTKSTTTRTPFGATNVGMPQLTANVGMHSLTPDGSLTLKVHGWQDVMAQINKNNKSLTA